MLSSIRSARSDSGTCSPSNSSARQPIPSPRISRPREIRSTTAASSARCTGSYRGASSRAVPISTREVRAAIAAHIGSTEGR
jgi:hypothetical protein